MHTDAGETCAEAEQPQTDILLKLRFSLNKMIHLLWKAPRAFSSFFSRGVPVGFSLEWVAWQPFGEQAR